MTVAARPDPDALLAMVQKAEERAAQAKLKVFFGFAPGVGKTYRMLEVARALREQGVDVVVGVVETHGRPETAELLAGLEVMPRRRVDHRGHQLEELDLDAVLARRPDVVLVDELAHTNVPGSRHPKRWQDVIEILDAGIDVLSTLNVQHVESLNDVVAQITHVQVRETVPDSILDRAEVVELVDLAPDELLARLRAGKVYLGEQAARAARHFFQRGNLLALRELALRRTAERVDADVAAYRSEHGVEPAWAATERILVCVGPAPASARLVRAARRIAAGLRAPWVAATVDAPGRAPLLERDRERLEGHLRLAESLGASVARLTGVRASEAVLAYARKHGVTRILLGKPTHSRLRDLVRGSMLDEIVRGSGDVDVLVISGDEEDDAPRRPGARGGAPTSIAAHAAGAALVAAVTGLAFLGDRLLGVPDVEMLYLLAIMVVAVTLGRGPSLLAAALAVLAFDFFFVPPRWTFDVADASYGLTFLMMFGVGATMSTLAGRLKLQQREALEREARTAALLALSRDLSSAGDQREVAGAAARHAADVFSAPAAVLGVDGGVLASSGGDLLPDPGLAQWVARNGTIAGLGTETLPGSRHLCAPIRVGADTLGVLSIAPEGATPVSAAQRDVLDAFARQVGLALGRVELAHQARQSTLRAEAEALRSSLLQLVSHDLRTPLAVITGAATALREVPPVESEVAADLVDTLCEEAERLERLVTNLLDMTRLEAGVALRKEWMPIEEVIGAALTHLERRLSGREVHVEVEEGLPLVQLDAVLGERLLANLVDNALKHTPAGGPIDIAARLADDRVVIEVADRGPGLEPGAEERIFERFQRGSAAGSDGVGLGLAIARAIAQAHGGTLTAHPREGGGARFRLQLDPGRPPASGPSIGEPPTSPEAP